MRIIKISHYYKLIVFIVYYVAPGLICAQPTHPPVPTDEELIAVARQIMTASGTCALITLDQEGRARVRTMDPFAPEDDMTVWLATNPKSRKVQQIARDPRVTLYYQDSDLSGYVMLYGKATLVDDLSQRKHRWKSTWSAFYPHWPDGYLLISVVPEWLEVVSYSHNVFGDSVTWQPKKVYLDDE